MNVSPNNPIIVQSDKTLLVEVNNELYTEVRDKLSRFAETDDKYLLEELGRKYCYNFYLLAVILMFLIFWIELKNQSMKCCMKKSVIRPAKNICLCILGSLCSKGVWFRSTAKM